MDKIKQTISRTFLDLADALETGTFGKRARVAVTGLGSEHGEENILKAASKAARHGIEIYFIGTLEAAGVTTVYAQNDEECHQKMGELLNSKTVDAAVTMHYPFPIGVSTVGRVITPAKGREMFIATTTGTSSTDRVEGLVKNTLNGITTAKTCGIADPSVGILNIDGARQAEAVLRELKKGGYNIKFTESARAGGGAIMRGNDVLLGTPDVLVCDPLTGNVLTKMLSAYTSGGDIETAGYGYGPGIGNNYEQLVLIVSRASGTPVILNAILYARDLIRGNWKQNVKAEYAAAEKAGLSDILRSRKSKTDKKSSDKEVSPPEKEPVPASIAGIEVMDIEDAVKVLWKNGIYAESGMGCTGPLVMMSEANKEKAAELLKAAGFID